MLKENPDNTFRIHGTVVREPQVFRNRDGSIKVAMTVAAEDEMPRADGGRSFQYLPVETFYGRRYVETYGDGVTDSVKKGDVVSASGRIEMHSWNGAAGPQAKLILFCLDTPVVVTPAMQPVNGEIPYQLHMADGAVTGQAPSGQAAAPQPAASPSSPDPPAAPLPDPIQLQGPKDSMPYVLHYLPAAPARGALPDSAIRQLPGAPTSMPFMLHMINDAAPPAPAPAPAAATVPDSAIRQLPGDPASMPFRLHMLDVPPPPATGTTSQAPAPAPVPVADHVPQLPGPATTMPFKLNMLPADQSGPAGYRAPAPVTDHVPQLPGPATAMPFRLNMLPAAPADPPAAEAVAAVLAQSDDDDLPFTFGTGSGGTAAAGTATFDTAVIEDPVTSPTDAPRPARRLDDYVSGASMPVASGSAVRTMGKAAEGPGTWDVKPHVRTLKSGRTVQVQGHVAHRRSAR